MRKFVISLLLLLASVGASAQFRTDRLIDVGRSALYYEDYVLSIQYFNQAILSKPYLYEPWFSGLWQSFILMTMSVRKRLY